MNQDNPIQISKNFLHKLQSMYGHIRFGFPANEMKIIGVTGTDGKTTTTSMIYHILEQSGLNVGYISTINAKIGDKELDTGLHVTTPDPYDVPRYLRMMADQGVEYVVLESTSNGLQQNRLWGVTFDSALITNIRSDHLDYHGTWENYANAKFMIVQKLVDSGLLILNEDDKKSFKWLSSKLSELDRERLITKSISKKLIENLEKSVTGMKFTYKEQLFETRLIGSYNIENILEVIEVCNRYIDLADIAKALKSFDAPKGRTERVLEEPFGVFVDFAHTPGGLESALLAVKDIVPQNSNLITVYGSAGKRDKDRRRMGEVSARLSDITILTVEDPRDETVADINSDILEFAKESNGRLIKKIPSHQEYINLKIKKLQEDIETELSNGNSPFISFEEDRIQNRQDAIELALRIAKKGDVLFITGKGHEKTLAFGDEETEVEWSDHEGVKMALSTLQGKKEKKEK